MYFVWQNVAEIAVSSTILLQQQPPIPSTEKASLTHIKMAEPTPPPEQAVTTASLKNTLEGDNGDPPASGGSSGRGARTLFSEKLSAVEDTKEITTETDMPPLRRTGRINDGSRKSLFGEIWNPDDNDDSYAVPATPEAAAPEEELMQSPETRVIQNLEGMEGKFDSGFYSGGWQPEVDDDEDAAYEEETIQEREGDVEMETVEED